MNNVEHISGAGHTDMPSLIASPAQLEEKTESQIEKLFNAQGYERINAADPKNKSVNVPLSALVRTKDKKIIHVGLQNKKQYWLNVIVQDANHPTEIEQHMMNLYAGGYRDIGNVTEGTEFKEFAAQNLTGPVARTYTGVVKSVRKLFNTAA